MIFAQAASEGGGAATADIALVAAIITVATIGVLAVVSAYRRGGARPLRRVGDLAEYVLRVPGWAAVPGVGAIAAGVIAFMGAIWDIGVHIDLGRDDGPFGTPAHYPFMVGLVGVYLAGVLAVGMAPRDRRESSAAAIRVPGFGPVPVGALLILAGGAYALIGFPLDDLWHRIFGQDVTLWGPTHTMFFGGLIAATCGAVILMAEGARATGRRPFGGRAAWRRPLPAVLGAIFLFVGTHATDEFNWGVPQYAQVWQPLMLALFGALGLVVARSLGGRGFAVAALVVYLTLQFIEVTMIGALGTTVPASVLYVVEVAVVEIVALRLSPRRGVRFGAVAGLGVGTIGFAAEYGWSHVAMPLPWDAALLPRALPAAILAGVAGGVLGVLMAHALTGTLRPGRRTVMAAAAAAVVVIGLAVDAALVRSPAGTEATLELSGTRPGQVDGAGRTQVADLRVRLSRPDLGVDGNWAYVLGWQGGGRFITELEPQRDGSLRSSSPVPVGGDWKTFVRIHKGRTQLAAPVRMPADPGVEFAGFPARPQVTRAMARDSKLLQIERREDGPTWAWTPALALVMALNLSLMVLVGAACVRAGRAAAPTGTPGIVPRTPPNGRTETTWPDSFPIPSATSPSHSRASRSRSTSSATSSETSKRSPASTSN